MPASAAACKTGHVRRTRWDCRSGWRRESWIQSVMPFVVLALPGSTIK